MPRRPLGWTHLAPAVLTRLPATSIATASRFGTASSAAMLRLTSITSTRSWPGGSSGEGKFPHRGWASAMIRAGDRRRRFPAFRPATGARAGRVTATASAVATGPGSSRSREAPRASRARVIPDGQSSSPAPAMPGRVAEDCTAQDHQTSRNTGNRLVMAIAVSFP